MKYVSPPADGDRKGDVLAVSTEDGRVVFYSTEDLQTAEEDESTISYATPLAQVGGKQAGLPGRIKDFEILSLGEQAKEYRDGFLVVTGNSDGVVRIWKIAEKDIVLQEPIKDTKDTTRQVGRLLSSYETGNRITCLASFIMLPAEDPSTLDDSEEDEEEEEESSSDEDE
jgi:protein MAK11